MYKVGICGHFGFGKQLVNGQTDKTNAVYKALSKALGSGSVKALDTCGWQKNPLKMLLGCRRLLEECENVIMMPSRGGFKVFPAVFQMLNKGLNRRLHYVVVGGWLAKALEENPRLIPPIKRLNRVYAELEPMVQELRRLGVENAVYMQNFRETNALSVSQLVYPGGEPLRLCTYSRVMRDKGIEEAVEAVRSANIRLGRTAYTLDIYGKVEPEYSKRFEELCSGFEPYISYKGFIATADSTQQLKTYFALLFPTVYKGEGFAGTIVDAFAAGVPVFATDWKYNAQIIRNGVDGIVYDRSREGMLAEILVQAAQAPQAINSMKRACLERAAHFEADEAAKILLKELETAKETVNV